MTQQQQSLLLTQQQQQPRLDNHLACTDGGEQEYGKSAKQSHDDENNDAISSPEQRTDEQVDFLYNTQQNDEQVDIDESDDDDSDNDDMERLVE